MNCVVKNALAMNAETITNAYDELTIKKDGKFWRIYQGSNDAAKRVARNALTVEDQRANEKDKVTIKAVLDRINSKGAQLAKDINAYYAMNEKMLAEEKRLNAAVAELVQEARSEARKYSRVERVYEDRDLVRMLNDLEFKPGWGKSCYKGSISHPTLINVPV